MERDGWAGSDGSEASAESEAAENSAVDSMMDALAIFYVWGFLKNGMHGALLHALAANPFLPALETTHQPPRGNHGVSSFNHFAPCSIELILWFGGDFLGPTLTDCPGLTTGNLDFFWPLRDRQVAARTKQNARRKTAGRLVA